MKGARTDGSILDPAGLAMSSEASIWVRHRDRRRVPIHWTFRHADARRVFQSFTGKDLLDEVLD